MRGSSDRRAASHELTGLTWPLPWWLAVAPALVVMVVTYLQVSQASSWAYVAPARLSGTVRESVNVTGPLVAVCAAWVAERYAGRRSPLSWPTLSRVASGRIVRVLAVVAVAWTLGQVGGGSAAIAVQMSRATGGTLYPVELLLAALGLLFFIATGFAIGAIVSRWYAPLTAVLWGLFWSVIASFAYPFVFADSGRNGEYFLFPALAASDHRGIDARAITGFIAWWIAVVAVVAVWIVAWYRHRSRGSRGPLLVVSIGVLALAAAGPVLPHLLPAPFTDVHLEPLGCEPLGNLNVCVSMEQVPLIEDIAEGVTPVVERMGSAFPSQITTVSTYQALDAVLAAGTPRESLLMVNVGNVSGVKTVTLDAGMSLGGIAACEPGVSDARAVGWAFALGHWLTNQLDDGLTEDPQMRVLLAADDASVLAWYAQNARTILACDYVGDGPQ